MMRQLMLCSGVQGRPRALTWLQQAAEARRPDAVLFVGGVLERSRYPVAPRQMPHGLTHDEGVFLEQFFETLGKLGVFCAIIPGPGDTPLEEFLRVGMRAEIESSFVHLVHATPVEKGDVVISGVGGPFPPADGEPADLGWRTLVEYHLRSLWTAK